jgi:hypothetical protein
LEYNNPGLLLGSKCEFALGSENLEIIPPPVPIPENSVDRSLVFVEK